MKDFTEKVAVITGASHGIGFGIAERCAREGMKVVLAGINNSNLLKAQEKLQSFGNETLCVQADVSKLQDIERLAKETLDTYGEVHLLVNNAGVYALGSAWEGLLEDWHWVLDVNLWGVIYGVRVFVPIMLDQDTECHIVNTSSIAGLLPNQPSAVYQVTKHAVVAFTENLYHSLVQKNTKIRVSVFCPSYVKTRIAGADRNRPNYDHTSDTRYAKDTEHKEIMEHIRQSVDSGITPREAADILFKGIMNEQLYILTSQSSNANILNRIENIINQRNPF
jgi:NADP-dependent 3-hydroxy acid dehydrogenase YdfG